MLTARAVCLANFAMLHVGTPSFKAWLVSCRCRLDPLSLNLFIGGIPLFCSDVYSCMHNIYVTIRPWMNFRIQNFPEKYDWYPTICGIKMHLLSHEKPMPQMHDGLALRHREGKVTYTWFGYHDMWHICQQTYPILIACSYYAKPFQWSRKLCFNNNIISYLDKDIYFCFTIRPLYKTNKKFLLSRPYA